MPFNAHRSVSPDEVFRQTIPLGNHFDQVCHIHSDEAWGQFAAFVLKDNNKALIYIAFQIDRCVKALTKAQSKAKEKSEIASFGTGAPARPHSDHHLVIAWTLCLSDSI